MLSELRTSLLRLRMLELDGCTTDEERVVASLRVDVRRPEEVWRVLSSRRELLRTASEDDDLLPVVWRPVSDGSKVLFPDSTEVVRVEAIDEVESGLDDVREPVENASEIDSVERMLEVLAVLER